jgi:hypothetical protein
MSHSYPSLPQPLAQAVLGWPGCGGDLSYLIAGLALGWRECLQTKVSVTRAMLDGDDEQANERLARAGQSARAWA